MSTVVIDGFIRDIQSQIHSYIIPKSINKLIAAFFDPVECIYFPDKLIHIIKTLLYSGSCYQN